MPRPEPGRNRRSLPIVTEAPPWTLSPAAIAAAFAGASAAAVVRSVVLRLAEEIRAGREPGVRGNLRTLGYRYLLPVWTHAPSVGATDWYVRLVRETRRQVTDRRALSYRDLDLTDENWESRRIGTTHPRIVAFGEDLDLVRLFRRAHERHGITTIAFGGALSTITAEYTAAHIHEADPDGGRLHLLSLADWDPSGYDASHALRRHFETFGFDDPSLVFVVRPEILTEDQRARLAVPITHRGAMKKALQRWHHETGGVDGARAKLEATTIPSDQLLQALSSAIHALAAGT